MSHHPPIGIAHTTCDDFTLSQESHIATRFWGTSVDVQSLGDNHLTLHKKDDHYTWKAPGYAFSLSSLILLPLFLAFLLLVEMLIALLQGMHTQYFIWKAFYRLSRLSSN